MSTCLPVYVFTCVPVSVSTCLPVYVNRESIQARSRPSSPGQRAGPERSASARKIPARRGWRRNQNPAASREAATVRMGPPACRESATKAGSMAKKKARISAGRGLTCSRKTSGTNTSALPASAGQKRARKLNPPKMKNKTAVRLVYATWELSAGLPPCEMDRASSASRASESVSGSSPRRAKRSPRASRKASRYRIVSWRGERGFMR